jgi:hypothetical protein
VLVCGCGGVERVGHTLKGGGEACFVASSAMHACVRARHAISMHERPCRVAPLIIGLVCLLCVYVYIYMPDE